MGFNLIELVRGFLNRQTQSHWPNRASRVVYVQSTLAGMRVTPDTALQQAAVFACVQVLSKSLAQLPWRLMRETNPGSSIACPGVTDSILNSRANPEMSAFTFRETMLGHALTWGNAFAEIERDGAGRPVALWPIEPDRVFVKRRWDDTQRLYYQINNQTKGISELDFMDVFHIHGPSFDGITGYQITGLASQSIGLAMAIERFGASFFGNNAQTGGIIQNPKTNLSPEARQALLASFNEAHRGADQAFRWAYIDGGMTAIPTVVEPEKGQFHQSSLNSVETICRWFGVPPHKVAHLARATNNNIEHQGIEFVTDGILPWAVRFEQEADFKLINSRNPQGYFTRMDVRSLQRGDLAARGAFYQILFDRGALSANDIREYEGMNEIADEEGGNKRFVALNMQLLETAGELDAAGDPSGAAAPGGGNGGGNGGDGGGDTQQAPDEGGSLTPSVPGPESRLRLRDKKSGRFIKHANVLRGPDG
jgi:HK97 family phage portal protein